MLFPLVVFGIFSFTLSVILFFKWHFRYWKKRGVPQLDPAIPFGHQNPPFFRQLSNGEHFDRVFQEIKKRGWKYCGLYFFTKPVFLTTDLDILKLILIKDFSYFSDRGSYTNDSDDPVNSHLFAVSGEKWHHLRTNISPSFSTAKLKSMFEMLMNCSKSLENVVEACIESGKPLQTKQVLVCFTNDTTGTLAFGLDCDTITNENSPFKRYGSKFVLNNQYRILRQQLSECYPDLARILGAVHVPRDVSQFYLNVTKKILAERQSQGITRKDFFQNLIDLNAEEKLGPNDLAAQCFFFFVAGMETTSSALTFAMYELARNQSIQQKVRDEIEAVLRRHEGQITYEGVSEMKYLSQVLDEAMRKYPPVMFVQRKAVKDYRIPEQNIVIEGGTKVLVPIYSIHHDPEHYPDPDRFEPDRFSNAQKASRHILAYLPFGEGPRMCVVRRFALMKARLILVILLRKYKYSVNSRTQEPLKIDRYSFIMRAVGDIWLNVERV